MSRKLFIMQEPICVEDDTSGIKTCFVCGKETTLARTFYTLAVNLLKIDICNDCVAELMEFIKTKQGRGGNCE